MKLLHRIKIIWLTNKADRKLKKLSKHRFSLKEYLKKIIDKKLH